MYNKLLVVVLYKYIYILYKTSPPLKKKNIAVKGGELANIKGHIRGGIVL